jgi:hypothetical protein
MAGCCLSYSCHFLVRKLPWYQYPQVNKMSQRWICQWQYATSAMWSSCIDDHGHAVSASNRHWVLKTLVVMVKLTSDSTLILAWYKLVIVFWMKAKMIVSDSNGLAIANRLSHRLTLSGSCCSFAVKNHSTKSFHCHQISPRSSSTLSVSIRYQNSIDWFNFPFVHRSTKYPVLGQGRIPHGLQINNVI